MSASRAAAHRTYGGTHATLYADVLAAWSVPTDLCSHQLAAVLAG